MYKDTILHHTDIQKVFEDIFSFMVYSSLPVILSSHIIYLRTNCFIPYPLNILLQQFTDFR